MWYKIWECFIEKWKSLFCSDFFFCLNNNKKLLMWYKKSKKVKMFLIWYFWKKWKEIEGNENSLPN
jgi:hypothetical protein